MPQINPDRPVWVALTAGGVGGAAGSIATCPLDLVKTRLQSSTSSSWKVASENVSVGLRTASILQMVYRSDGLAGLWRGLGPTLMGVVPARALYFVAYNKNREWLRPYVGESSLNHLSSAFTAGCTVSCLLSPIWVVKTRWQLQGQSSVLGKTGVAKTSTEGRRYRSLGDCVKTIFREEGVRGFYKGLLLSCIGASEGAIHFVVYEWLKEKSILRKNEKAISLSKLNGVAAPTENATVPIHEYLLYAAVARTIGTTLTYPHEVLRTRVREERTPGKSGKYGTLRSAVATVYRESGWRGFYAGMGVHMIRVVPNAAIVFTTYEMVLKALDRFQ